MLNLKSFLIFCCFLTGISIAFQWIMVWTGLFPLEDTVPGYSSYFLAFQLADLWLIFTSMLAGFLLWKKKEIALLFGIAAGSAMIFFGLYALLYDLLTGLFFNLSGGEILGKLVTFVNIVGGILFIIGFWKLKVSK